MSNVSYQLAVREGRKVLWLDDDIRPMGIHLQTGSGGGKSSLLGKGIFFQDFHRGNPVCVIDAVGQTINYFLNKIGRRHPSEQSQLWPRIRYVDISGIGDHVVPMPLYYRLNTTDTHYAISQ